MSLLGKLFSGLPSSNTSSPAHETTHPESHTLDDDTYSLLFPDADALHNHHQTSQFSSATFLRQATSSAYDVQADLDLEMRDVRVMIMQESTPITGSAYLLFDSHAPAGPIAPLDRSSTGPTPPLSLRSSEGRCSISSPRKSSIGQIARPIIPTDMSSATPRPLGAFERRSIHSKGHETDGQRSLREYREDVNMVSNCIFGSSDVWANKRTETKVHPLPADTRASATVPYLPDGSLGRSSLRSSKLSQSYTSENIGLSRTSGALSNLVTTRLDRKKVLITRIFPVHLPVDETTEYTMSSKEANDYFPRLNDQNVPKKPSQVKQRRTPMYAVGLLIHLPSAARTPSAPISRSSYRGPSSFTDQESCPSSYNSAKKAGWSMIGGSDSLESSIFMDTDDHLDTITQHWDIIMRSLSHLQNIVTAALLPMLRQADTASPDPRREAMHNRSPSASLVLNGKRLDDVKFIKPPKMYAKMIQLTPNCLVPVRQVQIEIDNARHRMITGIKARRVVTGQGRWGIWRDEARIVNTLVGGRDRGFFFYNLLTGFLGNHTEWLHALGSDIKRQDSPHGRPSKEDDVTLPTRTVIIARDKIIARRLIFLLAAFLPANQPTSTARFSQPRAISFGPHSQSPPAGAVPIVKEASLRRVVNKRTSGLRISRTQPGQPSHGITSQPQQQQQQQQRRHSDATSGLPIAVNEIAMIKNGMVTVSSPTPVTTKAHISNRSSRRSGHSARTDSNGSQASEDLLRSLSIKRGESSGRRTSSSASSQAPGSGWGSMITGFWSTRRRGSSATDCSPSSPHVPSASEVAQERQQRCQLAQMVDEVVQGRRPIEPPRSDNGSVRTTIADATSTHVNEQGTSSSKRNPDPKGAFESPVKMLINADGIVDVDVPLPDHLMSFETAVSSPNSSCCLSTPGLGDTFDSFESSRHGPGRETSLNVGGWLPHYHPDFALQAVGPVADLVDSIKTSMRAEPNHPIPLVTEHVSRQWVDVSSTLIADTTNFTIKRVVYQRLASKKDGSSPLQVPELHTPFSDAAENPLDERFIEEAVMTMDETLIEAVEKMLAHANSTPSTTPSRSRSRDIPVPKNMQVVSTGDVDDLADVDGEVGTSDSAAFNQAHTVAVQDVHRKECKKMILTALEDVVKNVKDELALEDEEQSPFLRRQKARRERANMLREGVRECLVRADSRQRATLDTPMLTGMLQA